MWGKSNWRILVVLEKSGINFSRIKERENLPKVLDISGGKVGGSRRVMRFCFIFWAWMVLTGFRGHFRGKGPYLSFSPRLITPLAFFYFFLFLFTRRSFLYGEGAENSGVYDYISYLTSSSATGSAPRARNLD